MNERVQVESRADAEERVARVWALWRRLTRYFPVWSLPWSGVATPGAWGLIGVDFLSGLRRNRSTRQTFEALEGVSEEDFESVSALAAVNVRRQLLIFRGIAIAYVTFPLSLLATAGQIAPESVERLIRENPDSALGAFVSTTVGVLYYLCSWWRARQIVDVLDLVLIERNARPYLALELRDQA